MPPSTTEQLQEHARHQRDHFAERALKALGPENRGSEFNHPIDPEPLFAESDKWNQRYERFKGQAEARRSRISIINEPLTYREDVKLSYFQDRLLMGKGDEEATQRIRRHGNEMRALDAEKRILPDDMEVRVNPNRKDGQGGFFSPPRWLIDQAATAARPNRVLSRLVKSFPLPPGASEISIPALTKGTKIEVDADDTPVDSQDEIDARVSSPVASIAGMEDVSIQLLEQSPPGAHLDSFLFKDLEESFDAVLEEQVIVGVGSPEGGPFDEFTGVLNLENINNISYTDGSPSGPKLFPYLGRAGAAIGKKRRLPPEAWLMTTARWLWICTQEDNSNRPLVLSSSSDTQAFPVGSLFGLPVYLDDALPIALGAGKNQDRIIACRPSDFMLLESEPKLGVMEDVLSGTLQVRLIMNRYAAFLGGKYPTGISAIEGTGMITQEGF
jgi:HK97 family phage major capsid protein